MSTNPEVDRSFSGSDNTPALSHEDREQIYVPTMGLQAAMYKLAKTFNPSVNPPQPGRRERELIARLAREEEERQEIEELKAQLRNYRDVKKRYPTFAVANQNGGGSKTTSAAYLAITIADVLHTTVAFIECRRDSAVGMDMLGINPEHTIAVREFYAQLGEIHNAIDILKRVAWHPNYSVIGIQANAITPENDQFGGNEANAVIKELQKHFVVVIDTGNNPSDAITIGMVKEADVGIFPTLPTRQSLKLRRHTMETFRRHGLNQVVDNSLHMVNALQNGNTAGDYRDELAVQSGVEIHSTIFDDYMHDDNMAHLEKILPQNRKSLLRMTAAAYRLADVRKQKDAERSSSDSNVHPGTVAPSLDHMQIEAH